MPAGLDGRPDPISTPARQAVLRRAADRMIAHAVRPDRMALVGVDGIDGAGTSTFADELAAVLRARGIATDRASIDSFHRPRAQRWAEGRSSPLGFYRDSHDLEQLQAWWARFDRYVTGQRMYLDSVAPAERADLVIDNNDFARPVITTDVQAAPLFTMQGL